MGAEQVQGQKIQAALTPLPSTIVDKVAIDCSAAGAIVIYAEKTVSGDPLLLTWVDRNRSSGTRMIIKMAPLDLIAKMRTGGMRLIVDDDDDQKVRAAALDLIIKAANYGASDMHFMLRGEHAEIQVVIKGDLRVLAHCTQSEGEALTRAIYQGIAKTRDDSYKPREFQNAQIPGDALPPSAGLTSLRIVRGPCYPQDKDGAFMTIRLQYNSVLAPVKPKMQKLDLPRIPDGEFGLLGMGYTEAQIAKLRTLMDAPSGLVIFTGPTGSGKTTSLFECLQECARTNPENRLVTIEDPVEKPMDWAVQMAVTGARNDEETGQAFTDRIRVALRMAPNAILVGEIRGPDVAVAALEGSITGHIVWTTLHIADPFVFVDRLELMDRTRLERKIVCDHKIVRGVIAQRLLPKLCKHCSIPIDDAVPAISERIVTALKTWGDLSAVRVKGAGCSQCSHDGTSGRFSVAEVVVTDAKLMKDFIEHGSETARANYRARPDADPSMLESAIAYVLSGLVDPRAVEKRVDLIEMKSKEHRQ